MTCDTSPAARALVALELIQNNPGITARRMADRLGVTERAARRYVATLREADLPIESVSGPYGGYRVGRGLRLPPMMFSAAEALGLVMAVLEGHPKAADPADPVGGALAKIVRVLPERIAGPVRTVREISDQGAVDKYRPSPELTTALIESSAGARRLRLAYRMGAADREMEVDPWAVVLRHSRWYLLCWSQTRQERRVLRVDRIVAVEPLPATFTPPDDLDALRVLEDHLSQGWTYPVDVVVDATVAETARWLPRSLARLEPHEDRTRLRATTDDPDWYARQLATIPAPFVVLGSAELRSATSALGRRLLQAADAADPAPLRSGTGALGRDRICLRFAVSYRLSRDSVCGLVKLVAVLRAVAFRLRELTREIPGSAGPWPHRRSLLPVARCQRPPPAAAYVTSRNTREAQVMIAKTFLCYGFVGH